MLSEDLDAAEAGYRVGYDDASHFNREYKRTSASRRCGTSDEGESSRRRDEEVRTCQRISLSITR
jgi:hypothetical protein